MPQSKKIITIEVTVLHETEKAYLLLADPENVWVPKSMCEWDEEDNTMQMPEWLAIEKELI